ncbi:MAG: porin family protein [Rhizobiales bacterium]|nr:porin family protein [Hyphomicrobiales bacterium]
MSKCKVGFIGALMLVLTGTTAGAADLGGDYRGSLKDDDYYEVSENTRGWYLRGDIGGTFYDDFTMTDSNAAKFILEDIDDNFMFGGGIGYNLMRGFRVDFTLDYRADADVFAQLDSGTVPDNQFTGDLSALVGLANFYYDLDMGHRITPYVGVGVGFAALSMDGPDSDDSDTTFAWALMAGVDIDLRSNWKLDIGYRYLNLGDGKFDDSKIPGRKFELEDLEAHEIRVGLRYQLGCLRDCTPSYESYK